MLVIEIRGPSLTRQVTSKKDGKQYVFRDQKGFFETDDGERRAVQIGLENDQADYPPGRYVVEPSSFFVEFGKFVQRRRLNIRPLAQPQAKTGTGG